MNFAGKLSRHRHIIMAHRRDEGNLYVQSLISPLFKRDKYFIVDSFFLIAIVLNTNPLRVAPRIRT